MNVSTDAPNKPNATTAQVAVAILLFFNCFMSVAPFVDFFENNNEIRLHNRSPYDIIIS
jgi:hypothetical protein